MASSETDRASEGASRPQVIRNAPRRRCMSVRLVDMAIASVACLFLVVQFLPGVRSKG